VLNTENERRASLPANDSAKTFYLPTGTRRIGSSSCKRYVRALLYIDPLNPTVETPEQVCKDLVRASKYIPIKRLGSTDDCGFSPFSIDKKPKHGSPDVAREIAFKKIAARVEGTMMASEKLGVI
jgi:methionine synthase II (cobalamin-independent)